VTAIRQIARLLAFSLVMVALAARIAVQVRFVGEGGRARVRARRQTEACRVLVRILGIRVRTVGDLRPGVPRLLVCNHSGILDGFVLASAMPLATVAKAEMAGWPVMGWVCRMVGMIFVDRARRSDAARLVETVQARMRSGVPVLVFPEGTVGDGRTLLPFRSGAFEAVAGASDMEVLPVFLTATRVDAASGRDAHAATVWHHGESLKAHARRLLGARRIDMEVRLGGPLSTAGHDRRSLAEASRLSVARLGETVLDPA
jgi:1-acyl-sn-glycerol-3-phosphate acyltransferase